MSPPWCRHAENLAQIRARGHYYPAAGWTEILRQPSPRTRARKSACLPRASHHREALRDHGVHTSWATMRDQRSTHQVITVVLPATDGRTLRIRKSSTSDALHRALYRILQMPAEVMRPVKTWAAQSP